MPSEDTANITRPLPSPEPETAPFWEGANSHKLLIQRCVNCQRHQFYPRFFCGACAGDVEWVQTSGNGQVHSFTIVRQNGTPPFDGLVPYVLALIDLDEGVRMMGNVVDIAVEDVTIGMPVEVGFLTVTDTVTLPIWRRR